MSDEDVEPKRPVRGTTAPAKRRSPAWKPERIARVESAPGFRVEGEHARGGLGRLLLAWDLHLARAVALKEPLDADPVTLARFEREARLTARLQHPSIVPVYQVGTRPDGTPFYAMRFVSGETLEAKLAAAQTIEERLRWVSNVLAVAEAVSYAHSEGVLHRDVKPANVLVGPFGETVLVDWGLARELDAADPDGSAAQIASPAFAGTNVGMILGSRGYMSPEQARGERVDERSDVYGLGATLHHVVTGLVPGDRPELSSVEDAPADLVAVIERAMAPDASDRYQTVAALIEDLRRWTLGLPVSAYSYSAPALLARWARRHRAAVAVAAAATALLVAGAVVAVRGVLHERDAATQSARELTLLQARSSLERDPTAAIAWLRTLPVDFDPRTVHALAADAVSRGIARHVLLEDRNSPFHALGFAGADPTLVGLTTSAIGVWDAAEGRRSARRPLDTTPSAFHISPRGDRLAYGSGDLHVCRIDGSACDTRPTGHLLDVRFAPDGRALVSAGADGSVRLWTIEDRGALGRTGRVIRSAAGAPIGLLRFDPSGRRLFVANQDGPGVAALDLAGGVTPMPDDHADRVWSIDVTPDGAFVLVLYSNGAVRIWDIARGVSFDPGISTRKGQIPAAAGRGFVAFEAENNTVVVVDLATRAVRQFGGKNGLVIQIEASPDGAWLAASERDGAIRLWSLTGADHRTLLGHRIGPSRLAFSNDGRLLGSAGHDGEIRVWPVPPSGVVRLVGHEDSVGDLAFTPGGKFLASTSKDLTVRLWTLDGSPGRVLRGHVRTAWRIGVDPAGRWIATTSNDATVRLWELASGEGRVLGRHRSRVSSIAVGGAGRWVMSGGEEGDATLWDVEAGTGRVLAKEGPIGRPAFSPDGALVAFGAGSAIHLFRVEAAGEGRRFDGHEDYVQEVTFSPDGRLLASASWDRTVRLWDVSSGESRVVARFQGKARNVAFAAGGRSLVAGSSHGELIVHDLATHSTRPAVGNADTVRELTILADGRRFATGSYDGLVAIWDRATAMPLRFFRDPFSVLEIAVSPDGRWIASGGDEGVIRVRRLDEGEFLPVGDSLRGWFDEQTSARMVDGVTRTP